MQVYDKIPDNLREVVDAARNDFLSYCLLSNPDFMIGPHHKIIADKLEAVQQGKIKRLMLFMPPRSSKTFMTSVYFPSWCMGKMPMWQMIALTHSTTYAMDNSREVRNLVDSDVFKTVFQDVELRKDSRAADRWHTNRRGLYVSAGVGKKIAGRGANLILIDDPISEQDAYSKAKRDGVNRFYPGGVRTRLQPNGRIVITNTRWHHNDLSGYLLNLEKESDGESWEIIKFPAIVTDKRQVAELNVARAELVMLGLLPEDYPEVKLGGTYWPPDPKNLDVDFGLRGWTTEELLETKKNSPPHTWDALYQQEPSDEEGNILKRKDWQLWDTKKNGKPPKCEYVLISADTAYSGPEQQNADYSAVTVWGVFKDFAGIPNMIMLGAQKGRWAFPDLRKKMFELYEDYLPDVILIEKKASGQSIIQELKMAGIPVLPFDPGDRDKVARAYSVTPIMHAGRVWAPSGMSWSDEVMYECAGFPSMEHDDYVDSVVQAITWIKNGGWVVNPEDSWQDDMIYDKIRNKRFYG